MASVFLSTATDPVITSADVYIDVVLSLVVLGLGCFAIARSCGYGQAETWEQTRERRRQALFHARDRQLAARRAARKGILKLGTKAKTGWKLRAHII